MQGTKGNEVTKTIFYECLYDRDVGTFYDEGYSSLRKAEKAMRRLRENAPKQGGLLGKARNFRIVRHEILDYETIVKTYPKWEK